MQSLITPLRWATVVLLAVTTPTTTMAHPSPRGERGGRASTSASPVVATFRQSVTEVELRSWLAFNNQADTQLDDAELDDAELDDAVRQLIVFKALANEAVRLGLDRDPAVRIELDRKDANLAQPLVKRQLRQSLVFTDEEVEAKYQSIKDTYARPRRPRLYNIFKRYPPDADEAEKATVRREMEAIRRRVVAGEDFSAVAKAESDSQTRLQGGLLGNVRPGTFRPSVDAVAMAMEEGEISEILAGPKGLTILYCKEILAKVEHSLEKWHEIARNLLTNQAYREGWAALEAAMLEAATLADIPPETGQQRQRMMIREVYARGLADEAFETRRLWTRRQILYVKAIAHLVQERLVRPTDDEIKALFDSRRAEFLRPPHYHLAVIALTLDPDDIRKTYRRAERLVYEMGNGSLTFADAAREHSQLPSARNGGDVGSVSRWAVPGRFGLDFLRAMLDMQIGERSDVVKSEGAVYIFEVRGIEDERPMTFEEARRSAENMIGNRRVKVLEAEVLADWHDKLDIKTGG